MAFYPKARVRLLTPESTQAPRMDGKPIQLIFHSAVGGGSLYDYFQERSNLESHFWVGLDGRVEQYVDTNRKADANYKANAWAISVETADNGDPDHFPWTEAQLDALADIAVWAHQTFGIPVVKCLAWNKSGMGYHTMWGAPSNWTPVAKSCPGKARIKQFPEILKRANDKLKPIPEVEVAIDVDSEVPVTGAAKVFITQRGGDVDAGVDNAMPFGWFIVWTHIETVRTREVSELLLQETRKTNQLLQELINQGNSAGEEPPTP